MPERLLAPAAMATVLCLTITAVPAQASAQASAQTAGTMNAEQGWSSVARCVQEDTERARHTCIDRVLREAGLLTNEMHARQQRRAFGLDDQRVRAAPPAAATATPSVPGVTPSAAAANTPAATGAEALNRRAAGKTPDGATPPANAAASPSSVPSPGSGPSPSSVPSPGSGPSPSAVPSSSSVPSSGSVPSTASTVSPASTASIPASAGQPDRLEVELAKVGKAADGKLFVTTTDGAVWLQTETVDMPQPPVAGDRMTIRKGSMGGYRCSVASTHLTYRCARNR